MRDNLTKYLMNSDDKTIYYSGKEVGTLFELPGGDLGKTIFGLLRFDRTARE
jgi:hypothetical protein